MKSSAAFVGSVNNKGNLVHVINCTEIGNPDDCYALEKFNPKRNTVCPTCQKLVYLAYRAKDYAENKDKYKDMVTRFHLDTKTIHNLVFEAKCSMSITGERLYVRKKNDTFYIDFILDDVKLFHNNYSTTQRNQGKMVTTGGFHEHPLYNAGKPDEAFKEALVQITRYKYEEAKKTHAKKNRVYIPISQLANA